MMKKIFQLRNPSLIAAIFSLAVVLTACSKDNDVIDTEVAGLMAFNLVPDKEQINIEISGSNLTPNPLPFTSFTGGYLSIYPGSRRIISSDPQGMEILDTTSYLFEPQKYYTVFVTGIADDYQNIIVHDNYDALTPQPGKAFVRFINSVPGTGEISMGELAQPAAYGQVSDFQTIDVGNTTVEFTMNLTDPVSRTIDFKENIAYTVLIAGIPGDINTDKALQIRYVETGRITE